LALAENGNSQGCHVNLHAVATNWNMTTKNIEVGRPQKKTKKYAGENIPMVNNGKLSRRSKTVSCVLCKTKVQNKRSCKGPIRNVGNKRKRSDNAGGTEKTGEKGKQNVGGEKIGNKGKHNTGAEKTENKGKKDC
nr:hypothetical protein [Tanacetum cinerariifolium]